jgi:hypothetical protein
MSPRPPLVPLVATVAAVAFVTLAPAARADDGFAEPPDAHVASDFDRPVFEPSFDARDPHASVFRILVGPAGKVDARGAQPGLFVATEFGKGPAGLRLEGAWLGVGNPRGIAEYTGELTLDFGGRSAFIPSSAPAAASPAPPRASTITAPSTTSTAPPSASAPSAPASPSASPSRRPTPASPST